MIDIQIQKSELIDVIENIVKEKVYVESDDACEFLATGIVNGLEELNSDETQANNLLDSIVSCSTKSMNQMTQLK